MEWDLEPESGDGHGGLLTQFILEKVIEQNSAFS